MQRLRVRYAKRGRLRFSSHRDFQRALERAIRRSGVPIAFSEGFTPHPKISYVGAAPTGTASEAEYLEIALADHRAPGEVRAALDAALPRGLDVLEVVPAGPGSLPERIDTSIWEIRLPGVPAAVLTAAVEIFLAAPSVPVERNLKQGRRTLDARAAVLSATATPGVDCAILEVVVRHTTPAVRPDDVLAGLRSVADLVPPVPPAVTRLAQGLLDAEAATPGRLADPLAPDRDAAGYQDFASVSPAPDTQGS